jgi:hypothetical protein
VTDESEDSAQQKELDLAEVKRHARALMEHFDNIQIFVNRHDPKGDDEGGTLNIQWGLGNWFARYGQIREWLVIEENRMIPPDSRDDEREEWE